MFQPFLRFNYTWGRAEVAASPARRLVSTLLEIQPDVLDFMEIDSDDKKVSTLLEIQRLVCLVVVGF